MNALASSDITLVEQALIWFQQNQELAIGAGVALLLLFFVVRMFSGGESSRGPRNPKQARAWAKTALKRNDYADAADYFVYAGDFEDAITAYSRAGLYEQAAEAAMRGGMKERAAAMLEKAKKYVQAAKIYQLNGRYVEAGELFVKAGNDTQAAEAFEAGGDWQRAAENYVKATFTLKAGDCFLKARDFKKAARYLERAYREERIQSKDDKKKAAAAKQIAVKAAACYEKIEESRRAVNLLSDAGFFEKAAGILRKMEEYDEAAELYLKANLPLQASELYRQMGDNERAARIKADVLRKEGHELEAADSYRTAGEFMEAAEIYRRHTRYAEAGACYVKIGDFMQAGDMFLRAKEPRKAAEAWEYAGDYRKSADVYQRLGDSKKQSDLLEKAGEYYEAGINFFNLKMIDDALRVLEQVPKGHPNYRKASVIVADVMREKGNLQVASKRYQDAIAGEKVNQGTIHPYYNLARTLEQAGDTKRALVLYTRIHAEDAQFADVATRYTALRKKAQEEVQREQTAPPETSSAPPAPRTKKRYTLLSELGRGGMGIVYKAHDQVLDRVVAFKMLPSDLRGNDVAVKNFLREAKAAAGLNNPNIVIVYDAGEEAGNYYIAMELIEGQTLREITTAEGKIGMPGLLLITAQLSKALEYAHGRNVVHRDIKGSNIMWTDSKMVKIMDFGLAKVIQEVVNFQTVVGGTPHYMAPEQILGEEIDCRADIYSLGVTLFECATGTVPFPKGDVGYHHIHTAPPNPRELNPELPELYADILLKCLAKDPAERFQDAGEIYEALKTLSPRQ